ncbi:hypothetical protein MAR_021016 [Mya arenaria]|uniref:Synaptotagmin-like mitochondrial and lipid-binding domain-containing protein n=1 Tax=Mya arenaria TaxID=6604 RepID=A0ABY7E6K2_MYAAR|nr:hypothetical protein MAR_021016 [Mya arenaria]
MQDIGVVNSLTSFFGPLQPRISWDRSKDGGSSSKAIPQGPLQPESTFWLNSALNWFYLHYEQFPEFVDAWTTSLNQQANKLGGPVQIKFEKVQSGSLPPKFAEVLTCRVDSRDLSFAVFASQQTHEGVKLTNLVVTVLKLRGQLKIRCYRHGPDMMAEVGFIGRPDIKIQGKPVNPYMANICLHSRRTRSNEMGRSSENLQVHQATSRQAPSQAHQTEVIEPKEVAQQQHSAFHVPTLATPAKTPQRVQARSPADKKLLVKVIKASGLKQNEDNFLGEAVVYCEDLQRNPSSRQIIPLQGRLGVGEFVSGSITVEVPQAM